jgi:hypothetical protein
MGSLYPNVARITLESDALQAWFAASRSRWGKMSLLVRPSHRVLLQHGDVVTHRRHFGDDRDGDFGRRLRGAN